MPGTLLPAMASSLQVRLRPLLELRSGWWSSGTFCTLTNARTSESEKK